MQHTGKREYYDVNRLINLKDLTGSTPSVYLVDGHRSIGKTTAIKRFLIKDYRKNLNQFIILKRYNVDLESAALSLWINFGEYFFPSLEYKYKKIYRGLLYELYINDTVCGFILAISQSNKIKDISNIFNQVGNIFFDEAQSEDGIYVSNEVNRVMSIYTSVARGYGEKNRAVRLILSGNRISLINPYYHELGINKRIKNNTRTLKGRGWVLERILSEDIDSKATLKAFNENKYLKASSSDEYLLDNYAFIKKPKGCYKYLCSILHNNEWYCAKQYLNYIYIENWHDKGFNLRVVIDRKQLIEGTVYISQVSYLKHYIKYYYDIGRITFDSLKSRNLCIDLLVKTCYN